MRQGQTWNIETSEVWTPVAGEIMSFVLLTGQATFFPSEISSLVFLDYKGFARQPCCATGTIDSFSHGNKCSFSCK